MTPVERLLRAEIAATGPVSVATFMRFCLAHPQHGYYITRDPLGQGGDFTTAPEISQMFGEMVGLWLASVMTRPMRLVELGPGRGTLMADALRTMQALGRPPAEVWLVETSPPLTRIQQERVPTARHATRLEDVPDGPALILANEFFDALPVAQYLQTPAGWRERRLGLVDDRLGWGLSSPLPLNPDVSDWWEHSAAAEAHARQIADRIARFGGAALLIDYGYRAADRPAGPTLQAIHDQTRADPLTAPGQADLTWLVDFDWLAGRMEGLVTHHADQGAFLGRLGIGARAAALAKVGADGPPGQADAIADALDRLTSPGAMGTLFKVLGVMSPEFGNAPPPSADAGPARGDAKSGSASASEPAMATGSAATQVTPPGFADI